MTVSDDLRAELDALRAFREYVLALAELHRLGLDTDAADVLRDEMDGPWYRMTDGMQGDAGKIAASLNVEADRRAKQP